jgi:hypothetical protein
MGRLGRLAAREIPRAFGGVKIPDEKDAGDDGEMATKRLCFRIK